MIVVRGKVEQAKRRQKTPGRPLARVEARGERPCGKAVFLLVSFGFTYSGVGGVSGIKTTGLDTLVSLIHTPSSAQITCSMMETCES